MILSVEDVGFSYDGLRGVSGLSLEVRRGGVLIALAGPNGSGKSTLLKLIARVLTPASGTITLEGRREWTAREYARRVGYLPQDNDVSFPMRAIDAVVSGRSAYLSRFALESEDDYRRAERALDLCDAGHLADRPLHEMSGGERKRVLLARVLVADPRVVLLDEPFSALDVAHVQQFSYLLRDIADRTDAAIIFASHDLNWAGATSDRMIVMRDGRIVRDDVPSAILDQGTVRELFGLEATVIERGGRPWLIPEVTRR